MRLERIPRPDWELLPFEGCVGVDGKVLLISEDLVVAMLRFARDATIHEHAADFPIDAICLEGSGFVSVGRETAPLPAGHRVRWPPGEPHRLWTEDSTMLTLMVEHHGWERGRRRPQ
jgi:quercetin dioxygenase-like cupin family protein